MTKLRNNAVLISVISFVVVFVVIVTFCYITRQQEISKIDRVYGVDISSYQGEVDWKEIEAQQISFAFIKATQGTDFVDPQFSRNWSESARTTVKRGAYLFFEYDSNVDKSLDLFYETVNNDPNALPPAIDIELEESKNINKDRLVRNLQKTVEGLSDHYHKTPIIYTNYYTYDNFLANSFDDVLFWICDLDSNEPELKNHEWTFWQYTFRGIINGVGEDVTFVDLDLYNGDLKQFYEQFNPTFAQMLGFS